VRPDDIGRNGADKGIKRLRTDVVHGAFADLLWIETCAGANRCDTARFAAGLVACFAMTHDVLLQTLHNGAFANRLDQ
jgi:hypothetical protein